MLSSATVSCLMYFLLSVIGFLITVITGKLVLSMHSCVGGYPQKISPTKID